MFDFLTKKFSSVFSRLTGKNKLTESNIQEALSKVKDALLTADVPCDLVDTFCDTIQKEVVGKKVLGSLQPGDQFIKIVHEHLKRFLGFGGSGSTNFTFQIPSVTMVMGLQGSGKTTSLGKLAHFVTEQAQQRGKKRRILLASVDFYRPAAVDQLEMLAKNMGVDFYRATSVSPIDAAQEIFSVYKQERYELLFLDTAGRLHIDKDMIDELAYIRNIVQPRYRLLVLDAMTGQESLRVAQAFNDRVGFDYAILSKMDSDARGGAAFAFKYAINKPVAFVGTGENPADLEQFRPERMADRILGMGDVLTLVEKAEKAIKKDDQEAAYKSFMKGKMTLEDFANQLNMVNKLGSLSNIAKYMPGMNAVSPEMLQKGEVEMGRFKVIIQSMTLKERVYRKIIDSSRVERIARGAGVTIKDVNILLERFDQSQQYVKLFKRFNRFQRLFK